MKRDLFEIGKKIFVVRVVLLKVDAKNGHGTNGKNREIPELYEAYQG